MKQILYIGNKLSHHGYSSGVIETLGIELENVGYKVYYAGTKKNRALRLLEMLWKTASIGRKVEYVIIDTYSTGAFWFAYMTGRLSRLIGKKYIPILHGGNLPARIAKSKHACDQLFLHSYANVAVSGYLQHIFQTHNYPVILIPNSVDLGKYPFKLRNNPKPKLLWVRAFSKIYNPGMAADVMAELVKDYPEASLCMVGPDNDGSLEAFKRYAGKLGVINNILITGKLDRYEWIKHSVEYDFFINTTNVDNTPVSVIEAMALGMIIVSTSPGGIPFLLKEAVDSKLVEPGDSGAMASAIKHFINHPLNASGMSEAARRKAESFSSGKTISLWKDLLS